MYAGRRVFYKRQNWAFNAEDLTEHMSMEHLRAYLERIFPRTGDVMVTNRRRPRIDN